MRSKSFDVELMETMMASLAEGQATLPPGRREEVVALLTLNFADPDKLSAYIRALESSRSRFPADVITRMINNLGSDVPWDQIRAEGFANLSDEVLADLATSPAALIAIDTMLLEDDEDVGDWFYNGILGEARGKRSDRP